ncbi:MAG: hypothetical protein JWR50_2351 [Mucilaginibacter sp.]|nr:hypothetical protein [Mucilaginibacter sp.]
MVIKNPIFKNAKFQYVDFFLPSTTISFESEFIGILNL